VGIRRILSRLKRRLLYFPQTEIAVNQNFQQLRLDEKCSPTLKAIQVQLYHHYRLLAEAGKENLPSIFETGFRVYSQFEEDGMILYLLAVIGFKTRSFIDIGAGNGIVSNCTNLAVNWGFNGVYIDGNEKKAETGRKFFERHPDTWAFPPKFICAYVKSENINQIIEQAGFRGEVDFVSIDIDGNDYWIWNSLEIIQPRIVMIETHVEFGTNNIVVPYDPDYVYPGKHPDYHGASPVAMANLARRKGYRLVGANGYGFNTIYIREDEGIGLIPTLTVDQILGHPRNKERYKLFEPIKDWEYKQG
jgi:hypothetical protein